jgi:hypothetical protein
MNAKSLVRFESDLFRVIKAQQNTLRCIKVVPTWEAFMGTEAYSTIAKELNGQEMRKYRATWRMFFELQRDPEDKGSILLATLYLIQERARRTYSKTITVRPDAYNISEEHAQKVKEFVLRHYGDLNPF